MIMIMKKTGLVIAAAAAAMILSGCSTCARDNMPVCETPCAVPCNSCKGVSHCKQVCPTKVYHKKHRHCRAENVQAQMNA